MKPISFSELGLELNNPVTTVEINDQTVEIKRYLPAQEKLDMISEILNKAVDSARPYFYDPGRYTVMFDLNLIKHYTNLMLPNGWEKDPCGTYDLLWSNEEIVNDIFSAIPSSEIRQLHQWAQATMNAVIAHTQSALGIVESITSDYKDLNLDAETIRSKLSDPESLKMLKEIASSLGESN